MKRIVANTSPLLVLGLTGCWLLLNETLSPGQILLGFALAIALGLAASALRPLHARLRRFDIAALLLLIVFRDIVRSNVAVARVILGLERSREVHSGFLQIPLELRDPHGLAALAMIVTSTPGTVWVGLSPAGTLTLHVLDLQNETVWIELIKQRYERQLMRIFE
jgi:multicomponent K+:H+ antiporter subunit E